jgi:hypothetical protein
MKGTLEFDLSDAGDAERHRQAVHAQDAYLALLDIAEALRNLDRFGQYTEGESELIAKIRNEFHEALASRGINLDRDIS